MKSRVVLLSTKVAVSSVSSIFSLIFMLSVLSRDASVADRAVCGRSVGTSSGEVAVGGTTVGGGGVAVITGPQAVTATRVNTIIGL